ncbi:MAG: hypothetical protein R6U55_00030, partial [Desulfovermiculus sp.]
QQFLRAWKQLSPILRAHLNQSAPVGDPWAYLAYFTASDALATLDQLGPALNIDISRDGLIRLATCDLMPLTSQRPDIGIGHHVGMVAAEQAQSLSKAPFPYDLCIREYKKPFQLT